MDEAISPWMRDQGPDSDIILSSRIRLARNFTEATFPITAETEELKQIETFIETEFSNKKFQDEMNFQFIRLQDLSSIEKRVLIEKHLISPLLAKKSSQASAALISQDEKISVMINEEDHLRIQLYFPGLQLTSALEKAFEFDDWLEEKIDYAFDEKRGYLTSCPTNVGTGMRASVMMHLPALVMTKQLNRMIPAINQLGLVVRGLYGEGSEALGNLFQISNQVTLGQAEEDIIGDLQSVVEQLIEHEHQAREQLMEHSETKLVDRIYRSLGVLEYSRIIESKEASRCLSDVRLGIDLGIIKHIPCTILSELTILTQPGFLQHYAKKALRADERNILRASLIRERLKLEEK